MIEDPISGDFFQLGLYEYEFARRLDGENSLAEALSAHSREYPDSPIGEFEAFELCQWLVNHHLAQSDGSSDADRMSQRFRNAMRHQFLERINPIVFRFAIRRPAKLIDQATSLFGWIFGTPATIIAALVIGTALIVVSENWQSLSSTGSQVFTGKYLVAIAIATVLLKVVHEFAHAIACRRYGGSVGEMGVLLILFIPLAYVDVNSIWRIRSKHRRVHVALAGIYVELLIASFAILSWCMSTSPSVQFVCFSTAMAASFTTLLFNANPLMRFDGYYVLTDLFGCTNLYSDANLELRQRIRRFFFGGSGSQNRHGRIYRVFLLTYGCLSYAWKIAVCCSLLWATSHLFDGLGTLVALMAASIWFLPTIRQAWKEYEQTASHQRRRIMAILMGTSLISGIVFFFAPLPGMNVANGVVVYADRPIVRAGVPGFIETIHVESGEVVKKGQPLITLRNEETNLEVASLAAELARLETQIRQLNASGEQAAAQALIAKRSAISNQLSEKQLLSEDLVVRAPSDGTVVARTLDQRLGTFVAEGDELLSVVDESNKELVLYFEQSWLSKLRDPKQIKVCFRDSGGQHTVVMLNHIDPRAEREMEDRSLYATNGGAFPVTPVSAERDDDRDDGVRYELLTPHFKATGILPKDESRRLNSGQRISVRVAGLSKTLYESLYSGGMFAGG
ncbi:MAG: HlyD family efflux transporter periplasmic adaptor subunit [Planctomycetota bacterium]